MLRKLFVATNLLLALAVAPAQGQAPVPPGGAPEGSTAARTMAQNRRVVLGPPGSFAARPALPAQAEAKPAPPPRRVVLAEGERSQPPR